MEKIVCPKCGKNDMIAKVPGIVAGGTSTGTFSGPSAAVVNVGGRWGGSGGYSSLSGGSTTDLAKLLLPPIDPTKNAGVGCIWWFFAGSAAIVALLSILILLVGASHGLRPDAEFANILVAAVSGSLFVFAVLRTHFSRVTKAEAKVPAFKEALLKWQRSYYCARDNVVFDPEGGDMADLLDVNRYFASEQES